MKNPVIVFRDGIYYVYDASRRHLIAVVALSRDRLRDAKHHATHFVHEGHTYAHLAYFAGVFCEGHGFYSTMAGIMFIIGCVERFSRGEGTSEK